MKKITCITLTINELEQIVEAFNNKLNDPYCGIDNDCITITTVFDTDHCEIEASTFSNDNIENKILIKKLI